MQIGAPTEEELKDWAWHSEVQTVDDEVLRVIGGQDISFVFTLHVPGCAVEEQCGIVPGGKPGQAAKRCDMLCCRLLVVCSLFAASGCADAFMSHCRLSCTLLC